MNKFALPLVLVLVACTAAGAVRDKRGLLGGYPAGPALAPPAPGPALGYAAPAPVINYPAAPVGLAPPPLGLDAPRPALPIAPAPATRLVTVNKLVNVQKLISVPQVVTVQRLVTVPQLVPVNKLVTDAGLPVAPGYGGGCAGGWCGAAAGW